jgi:Mg2+/Co2+ transporter CorB
MLRYLYTLLLLCVIGWSSWATCGVVGLVASVLTCVLAAFLRWSSTIAIAMICFFSLLLLIALLLPAVSAAREPARRAMPE